MTASRAMAFVIAYPLAWVKSIATGAALVPVVVASIGVACASTDDNYAIPGQTVQQGGITITLDPLQWGQDGAQLSYSYGARSGERVEPIGLPKITLTDGSQLEATRGSVVNSEAQTFRLPPIPEGAGVISVDLPSLTTYAPGSVVVEIPLGDWLSRSNAREIHERETIPLDTEFAVGTARYQVAEVVLDPQSFTLVINPKNDAARRAVLGGDPSVVSLADDRGQAYRSSLVGVRWSPNQAGGHVMTQQEMFFAGQLRGTATVLTLRLGEVGKINDSIVIPVEAPIGG